MSAFLHYTASFILFIAIVFSKSNLFWDCANGFVNMFSVHNVFNMEVNGNVSYDGNRNLSELINKSEPGSNGSNKNAILVFLFFYKFIFSFANKTKT